MLNCFVASTYECSLFRKVEKVACKAKYGYNPNRNTALDIMLREQSEENDHQKGINYKSIHLCNRRMFFWNVL